MPERFQNHCRGQFIFCRNLAEMTRPQISEALNYSDRLIQSGKGAGDTQPLHDCTARGTLQRLYNSRASHKQFNNYILLNYRFHVLRYPSAFIRKDLTG